MQAQELVQRKHGSILEQIQQSALHNDPDAEIKQLLDYAATFKGTRYRSGSSSPNGFDCSGFTSYVFSKFGYSLTRSSSSQINDGDPVEKHNLRPGDLVFFNGRAVGKRIGHVGIVTEVDSAEGKFKFIHASNSRGVTVSTSEEPYYKRRYVGACRPTKESPPHPRRRAQQCRQPRAERAACRRYAIMVSPTQAVPEVLAVWGSDYNRSDSVS